MARRLAAPVVTALVLAVALVIGSGALDPPPPSRSARIAALDRNVKCPTCVDLSIGQSTDPSSLVLRQEIARDVDRGESDATILAWVVSRYGSQALLDPSDSGLGAVLWAVPVALGAVALASGAATVVRRRRA